MTLESGDTPTPSVEIEVEAVVPAPEDGLEAATSSMKGTVGRAALVILGATVFGRLIGLVRDQVVAYYFGMGASTDAFFLAYKVPFLLSLTVGGALTATFIPVFTQRLVKGDRERAWSLAGNMINAIGLILVLATVVLILAAPLIIPLVGFGFDEATADQAVFLFRILVPGVIFTGLAGLAIGVLNSLKHFGLPAFSTSAAAALAVLFVVLFQESWGITSLAVGTTLGAFASLVMLLPQMRKEGMRLRARIDWQEPGMRYVGMLVWPILIGSAVGKVSIFADQTLASTLPAGAVSALSYSEKLFQLPLGLFVAGITVPLFPLLSEQVAANQPERLKATLNFALRLIAFVMIPATAGLVVLREPIVALLFEHGKFAAADTERTAFALLFYSLGLFSYAGRDTLTRVFYAYHDTRTPVKISVATVFLNIAVSIVLMMFLGVGGLALGTTIALTVNFLVLVELLRRKLGPMGFGRLATSTLRTAVAAVIMGAIVWAIDSMLAGAVDGTSGLGLRVGLGVFAGALSFVGLAWITHLPELRETLDMLASAVRRRR